MNLKRNVSTLDQQLDQFHASDSNLPEKKRLIKSKGTLLRKTQQDTHKAPTSLHGLPCMCTLCQRKVAQPLQPLKQSRDAVTQTDWQNRDATTKRLNLSTADFDFSFVLRRIKNPIGQNQITLALVPTALFEHGACFMFVSMDPQKYFARPRFVIEPHKLAGFNLEKLIAQPQPEEYYNHETVVRQKELRMKGAAKNARSSLFGSVANQSKESRPGSGQRSLISSDGSPTLSPSKAAGSSAFSNDQGGAELIKYSLLMKKTASVGKIDFSRQQLLQCLQVGKDQRALREVMYIQKLLPGKEERIDTFRKRFDLRLYEENSQNRHTLQVQLFKKAEGEPLSMTGRIQKISNNFRTPEKEIEILLGYQIKDVHLYAEYVNCKLYHTLKVFANIELKAFISEFTTDQYGNVLFSDIFLIQVESLADKQPGALIGKDLAAYKISQLEVEVKREAEEKKGVVGIFGTLGGMISGSSGEPSGMALNFGNLFALPELSIPPPIPKHKVRKALTTRGGGLANRSVDIPRHQQIGVKITPVDYLRPGGKLKLMEHKRHAEILSRSTNPDIWQDDPTPQRGVWKFETDKHRVRKTLGNDQYDSEFVHQSVERQEWGEDLLVNIADKRALIEKRRDWQALTKLEIWEDQRKRSGYKSTLKGILLG